MGEQSKQPQSRAQREKEEAQARRKEIRGKVYDSMDKLAELRLRRDLNQERVAKGMGASQPFIADLEKQTDPRLSTLAHYVEALGGQLQVRVHFRDMDKEVWLLPKIVESR